MHLTALVQDPDHVCCRYRLAAYRPYFETAGHSLTLTTRPRHWWHRLLQGGAKRYEVAILQRRLLSAPELHLLRRRSQCLIFDFDDAVWLRDSYAAKGQASARRLRRFVATVRAADAVIAGNGFLADQARRYTERHRIHVIPTCVDPDIYLAAQHDRRENGVSLVWIGSSSTLRGLERFATHLNEIGRSVPGIRLKLICERSLSLQNLPVDVCPWHPTTEAAELAAADIGIAWMPDDDWSRGKCGLKVLQYMAAGLPVVANPVGVHREMIRHGETGFLAPTTAEWTEAIRMLAEDAELRRSMGAAGQRTVEARYSVRRGAERWLSLLPGLHQRRQAA